MVFFYTYRDSRAAAHGRFEVRVSNYFETLNIMSLKKFGGDRCYTKNKLTRVETFIRNVEDEIFHIKLAKKNSTFSSKTWKQYTMNFVMSKKLYSNCLIEKFAQYDNRKSIKKKHIQCLFEIPKLLKKSFTI